MFGLHDDLVDKLRDSQKEIESLREEVERLQTIIYEASEQEPVGEVIAHVNGNGESIITCILSKGTKLYVKPIPSLQATQVAHALRLTAPRIARILAAPTTAIETTNMQNLNDVHRLLSETAYAARDAHLLADPHTNNSLPLSLRSLALRHENDDFQKARAVIKAHQRGAPCAMPDDVKAALAGLDVIEWARQNATAPAPHITTQSPIVAVPDECCATGQSCDYEVCTLNGERQCKYCGKEHHGVSSPRITEQDAYDVILSFYWFSEDFLHKNGHNPSVVEWYAAEGSDLLNRINTKNGGE